MIKCAICKRSKNESQFEIHSNGNYRTRCKKCRANWTRKLMSRMKQTSNEKGWHMNIKPNNLREMFDNQNGKCFWLNIPLDITGDDSIRKPSVDRIDNSKGYTIDNIVISSTFANLGRCSSTKEEFEEFLNKYIK